MSEIGQTPVPATSDSAPERQARGSWFRSRWFRFKNVFFRRTFLKRAAASAASLLVVLFGFEPVWGAALENQLSWYRDHPVWGRLGFFFALFVLLFVLSCWMLWPRKIEAEFKQNQPARISVKRGNLIRALEDGHIHTAVVGTSTSFETNPGIVVPRSLQAKILREVFETRDETEMQRLLSADLRLPGDSIKLQIAASQGSTRYEPSEPTTKNPVSGRSAYPAGTISIVRSDCEVASGEAGRPASTKQKQVLFLAYTQLVEPNCRNCSPITLDINDLWTALIELWEFASHDPSMRDDHGKFITVGVPLFATANAGAGEILSDSDALELILLTYSFASRRHDANLPPVEVLLLDDVYDTLDLPRLQAFVKTLEQRA